MPGVEQLATTLVTLGEAIRIELIGLDLQPVATTGCLHAFRRWPKRAAEPRHAHLQSLGGRGGRFIAPQRLRQRVGGDRLTAMHEQRR
jgi:hypothetical protein